MNHGSQHSPYRPPCGGTVLCSNGPRYQHAKPVEKNVPVYLYDAQVCDWHWDACGNINPACSNGCNQFTECGSGTIDPYERYAVPTPGAPCSAPGQCGPDCPSPPCQPCGPWCYDAMYPGPTPTFYQPWMCTGVEIVDGGSGYVVGETLGAVGGTISNWRNPNGDGSADNTTTAIITSVDGTGKITGLALGHPGSYQTVPASPNAMVGVVHGSGASINLTFAPQTEDLSVCHKYGYKNVQALRYWHGAPGYFFDQGTIGEYQCPVDTEGDLCNWLFYNNYSDTASQTKYTSLDYSITYDYTDYTTPAASYSVEQGATIDVDPNSGLMTASGITNTDDGSIHNFMAGSNVEMTGFNINTSPIGWLQTIVGLPSHAGFPNPDYIYACDSGSWSVTDNTSGSTTFGDVLLYANWSFGAGTASGNFYDYYDVIDNIYQVQWSFTITDSSLSFIYTEYFPEGDPDYKLVVTFTVTLSGANTSGDIQSDINTLLDEWDMTDDALYPWRTDSYTSIVPLVTRDEAQGNVNPWNAGILSPGWTDPNAGHFTGDIVGSPLPAGYQGYFDFNYVDWEYCAAGSPPYMYEYGFGQKNTGQYGIPINATQWTPNNIAIQYPGGAWIFYNANPSYIGWGAPGSNYNYPPAQFCIAQKWAETKMGFASQNFARPAGADKFAYDETNVYTVNSITGSGPGAEVYLIEPVTCATVDTTSNPGTQITCNVASPVTSAGSGLWGGPSVGGFYTVTGNGNPFTLGTLAYAVPSDWMSQANWGSGNDSTLCFGELRFPNAPAILGRAGIQSVANASGSSLLKTDTLTTLALGQSAGTYDYVDIYDKNMNALASNEQISRPAAWSNAMNYTTGQCVSESGNVYQASQNSLNEDPASNPSYWNLMGSTDQYFIIGVSAATIANADWIMSHGAPNYYWDDTYPKGDYAYTDWTWWPRQIGEANQWNSVISGCEGLSAEKLSEDGYPCTCPSSTETIPAFAFSAFTQEAGCVGFSPCNPSVICISPNDDDFAVGHTYSFPVINFDEYYGSGWQAEIQQVMQDLLWQTPHFPATEPCSPAAFAWLGDDGTCAASGGTTFYYPHPPLVECRITLPTNGGPASDETAPALPASSVSCCGVPETVIGWTSPVGFVSGACFPNNTIFPPNANGYGLQSPGIWHLWSNECTCIDGSGVFAGEYENNVIGCI